MVEIVWSPRAIDDLEALVDYIGRDSMVCAKRFASRLIGRIGSLSTQPDSGTWVRKMIEGFTEKFTKDRIELFIGMRMDAFGSSRFIMPQGC